MSDANVTAQGEQRPPLIERLSGAIALFGGLLLFCVAALVVVSVVGRWLSGTALASTFPWLGPVNGDFEMVQMATAVAVFSFPALLPGPPRQHRRRHLHQRAARARQRLHRCILGCRLCRHDGPADGLPGDGRDRALPQRPDHHAAAAHRLAGARVLRRALRLADVHGIGDGGHAHLGTRMSGVAIAALGFGAMLLLICRAHAGRAVHAGRRIHRLHPSVQLAGVLRLHEDQPLLSVRQLHPLRHPAVHPDGRACRARRHIHQPVPRRRGIRRAHAGRAGHGGDLGLHRVRRHLRLLGGDHGHLRPGGAARAAAATSYDDGFATGTIAVGGTLGILIPPSIILVVYAITTEQNIAKLFKAALIPGLHGGAVLYRCRSPGPFAAARRSRRRRQWRLAKSRASRCSASGRCCSWLCTRGRRHLRRQCSRRPKAAAVGAIAMLLVGLRPAVARAGREFSIASSRRRRPSAMIFIILLGLGGVRRLPRARRSCRQAPPNWSASLRCRPTPS